MEFVELIHAKSIGLWWGSNIHYFILFKNYLSEMQYLALMGSVPFCDTCDIICIHYCILTLFHDNALLLTIKVCSHSHFVYFLCMIGFRSMIILVSIDLLVNYHVCVTLFSRDPIFRNLEGCYGLFIVPSR